MLTLMVWPPQSPDLNGVVLLWEELNREVHAKEPTSEGSLFEALETARQEFIPCCLTLTVPSANSVSPLEIATADRLILAIHKNCVVYLFL